MAHPDLPPTRQGPGSTDASLAVDAPRQAIATAIAFIAAQPSGPGRLLAIHAPLPDGTCRGCLTHATRWPCTIAAFARSGTEQDATDASATHEISPAGGQSPWALPHRAGRAQMPVPGDPLTRPDREGPHAVGDAVEARPECLRDHLRRSYRPQQRKLAINTSYTVDRTDPRRTVGQSRLSIDRKLSVRDAIVGSEFGSRAPGRSPSPGSGESTRAGFRS